MMTSSKNYIILNDTKNIYQQSKKWSEALTECKAGEEKLNSEMRLHVIITSYRGQSLWLRSAVGAPPYANNLLHIMWWWQLHFIFHLQKKIKQSKTFVGK